MANTWRDEGKERLWRERLKRQGSSDLTVREFCQREGVTESSFYACRRTIAGVMTCPSILFLGSWRKRLSRPRVGGWLPSLLCP